LLLVHIIKIHEVLKSLELGDVLEVELEALTVVALHLNYFSRLLFISENVINKRIEKGYRLNSLLDFFIRICDKVYFSYVKFYPQNIICAI